jgi:hypothetical protein
MTDEELKAILDAMRKEHAAAHETTQRHVSEAAADSRHLFRTEAEALRHEVQLVAEGVADTREMLERQVSAVSDEVRRTAAETQAMIKFSHAEPDRRVTTLEQSQSRFAEELADLQSRVERLEGSPH